MKIQRSRMVFVRKAVAIAVSFLLLFGSALNQVLVSYAEDIVTEEVTLESAEESAPEKEPDEKTEEPEAGEEEQAAEKEQSAPEIEEKEAQTAPSDSTSDPEEQLKAPEKKKKAVKVAATTEDLLDGDHQYLTRAKVSSMTTGTAPFDDDDSAGNDSGQGNSIVRTYDSLNYTISVVSKGYDTSLSFKSGYTWYRFVVPGSDSAQEAITDTMSEDDKKKIFAEEMEVDVSSMGWMTKGTGTEYDYELKVEKVDGKWSQVLYASNYLKSSSSAFPIALSNVNLAINVKNMRNGDTIQPTFYAWIDHNDVDKENWDPNYVCSEHRSGPNGGKELRKFTAEKVTVSAAPKYNVQIKPVATSWVGTESDFDFTTGNDNALNKNGSYNALGQLREYGLTVQLYNDSPSKGLKGIEMPKGPITFDMDIGATYEGTSRDLDMSGNSFFVPKIWSYDRNNTSANKKDARNLSDYTNIYYARSAAPLGSPSLNRGKIQGTRNSGTWEATQSGSKVSFTVRDYVVDPTYIPVLDHGDYSTDDYTANVGGFSAGQIYIVIPYGHDSNELLDNYGSGHINLDLKLNNFRATSLTNQNTNVIRNPELDHINQSIEFVGPGEIIDELMWTYPHRNGETSWSDVDGSTTHYDDGGDSAQTGKQVDILFGYGITNNSSQRSWYGIDTLMTFDPTAFEFDTEALQSGEITSLIEQANRGDGDKQEVKYYFAVASRKLSDDEMKAINVDGRDNSGNLVADLRYYEDYEQARSAGTIVGALQSVRYPDGNKASLSRLYGTGVLHLKVRSDSDAMKPVEEGGILNGVYGTTICTRGYLGNGNAMPAQAVTSGGAYNKTVLDQWFDQDNFDKPGTANSNGRYAVRGNWTKAEWAENGSIVNAGAGGHWWGDSLHIVPYKAGVTKNILQTTGADHAAEKQTYNLDNNQNTVDFKMTPSVSDGTAEEGDVPIEITLTDTLDEGLIVDPEKVYYGGTYTENPDQGFAGTFSGGITAGNTSGEDGVEFKSIELTDELDENEQPTGRKVMTIVLGNVHVNQELKPVYYSADIFLATSYKNRQYENTVVIDAPGDRRVKAEPQGNLAKAGFTVEKNLSLSLAKRSEKPVYDIGEDVSYILSWANTGANPERNCVMMDSMPKDGYGNSSFKGTYNLIKNMTVVPAESVSITNYSVYYTEDEAAHELISGDYAVRDIRENWTELELGENGEVTIPEGLKPSAWCIIGNIPSKEQVECRFTIDCKDAQPEDIIENVSSLKEGSVTSTTRVSGRRLSGLTWLDDNKDGKRDSSEKALSGVTVKLYALEDFEERVVYRNLRDEECSAVTDEDGKYMFDALGAGKYIVEFTSGDQVRLKFYDLTEKQADGVDRDLNSDAESSLDEDDLLESAAIYNDLDAEDVDLPEVWDYAEIGYLYELTSLDAGFYRIYPEITIEKTVDKEEAQVGDTLVYTITVDNTSKLDAEDYVITDTLGDGLRYISDDSDGEAGESTISWIKTIPAEDSVTIEVEAEILENAGDEVENVVKIAPPDDPGNELEDNAVTEIIRQEEPEEPEEEPEDEPEEDPEEDPEEEPEEEEDVDEEEPQEATEEEEQVIIKVIKTGDTAALMLYEILILACVFMILLAIKMKKDNTLR